MLGSRLVARCVAVSALSTARLASPTSSLPAPALVCVTQLHRKCTRLLSRSPSPLSLLLTLTSSDSSSTKMHPEVVKRYTSSISTNPVRPPCLPRLVSKREEKHTGRTARRARSAVGGLVRTCFMSGHRKLGAGADVLRELDGELTCLRHLCRSRQTSAFLAPAATGAGPCSASLPSRCSRSASSPTRARSVTAPSTTSGSPSSPRPPSTTPRKPLTSATRASPSSSSGREVAAPTSLPAERPSLLLAPSSMPACVRLPPRPSSSYG